MGRLGFAGLTIVTALGATGVAAQQTGAPRFGTSYPPPVVTAPVRSTPSVAPVAPRLAMPPAARPAIAPKGTAPAPLAQAVPGAAFAPGTAPAVPVAATRDPAPGYRQPYRAGDRPSRWGNTRDGRWAGGSYAPGGWTAYRRPSRGARLPRYWDAPDFYLGDYAGYGLASPPPGYRWHRYYDDAVLLDPRGRVWDSVDGVDWDRWGDDDAAWYGADYAPPYAPLPPVVQQGGVTTYSTSSGYAGSGYYPGATTVVTIQGAPVVTTTTTTTEYIERARYVGARRAVHARAKRRYRPVRRTCGCVATGVIGS